MNQKLFPLLQNQKAGALSFSILNDLQPVNFLRRFFIRVLRKPILYLANKYASDPDKARIDEALTGLLANIRKEPGKKGLVIPFDIGNGRFIIFSDQHKGRGNGADDFLLSVPNYLAALEHYYARDFTFISLGDSEELWENNIVQVKHKNKANFEVEKKFVARQKMVKIFGNHDLYWANDPLAWWQLESIYGKKVDIYEGLILRAEIKGKVLDIFCTHGHQGDAQSDGNWFSKFFVSNVWAPLQAYLKINPNTPAYDAVKKSLHNEIMYEWSSQQSNTLLITGHTHQPVFTSLTHIERLYKQYQFAEQANDRSRLETLLTEIKKREKEFIKVSADYMSMKPYYFNSGCCCYIDGDITGIEIDNGCIRLIKWTLVDGIPVRQLLEETELKTLL